MEALIQAGAFDWTGLSRARMFAGLEFAMSRAESIRADRASGQINMFDLMGAGDEAVSETNDEDIPEVPLWPNSQMLAYEKFLLGFYITGNPLDDFAWEAETFATVKPEEVAKCAEKDDVRCAGIITQWRKFFNRKGQPMASFRLEGLQGSVDTVLFGDAAQKYADQLQDELPVMVAGSVKFRNDEAQIAVEEVCALEKAPDLYAEKASVHLAEAQVNEKDLRKLRELLVDHTGVVPLHFCVTFPTGEKVFLDSDSEFKVHPDHRFKHAVEQLFGEDTVYVQPRREIYRFPRQQRSFGMVG
jgi:DNA polymerase-3 subunit alpha